tara:strand:+ start:1660 stop:2715 length:1056 start_codon:yes stop_codon:yes gene_type:complete
MGDAAIALAGLARLRDPASQGRLALGITDLCVAAPLSKRASPIAGEILVRLAEKAEQAVRIAMAEALAGCDWAPHGIIRFLAFDAPPVAREVILRSLCLTDADLIEVSDSRSEDHRCFIAQRPGLSGAVSDALCLHVEHSVLQLLASNTTATLTPKGFEQCAETALEHPQLGDALCQRPDIPERIAKKLFDSLSQAVRDQLSDRFEIDRSKLQAVAEFSSVTARVEDEDEVAARLIEKLQIAETLNPGFAVKALAEGKEILFDHALAALCGLSADDWRKVLGMSGARAIALACRAARIDRSIFPTVLRAMQHAGRVHHGIEEQAIAGAARIFRDYTPGKAHDSLRRIADSA